MKNKGPLLAVLAIALLLVILSSYLSYYRSLSEYTHNTLENRLQEIVEPNLVSFDLQISEQIKKVKTMADYFGQVGELGDASQRVLLRSAVENNGLLRCAIAFPDGSFVTHDNKNDGNVSESPFFLHSMRGEVFITDPMPAVVDPTKTVMLFACPIYQDQTVIGSLIYSYLCDDMDAIFSLSFLEDQGQMLVVKKNGDILIGRSSFLPGRGNILDYLSANCTHSGHAAGQCIRLTGESGSYGITLPEEPGSLLISYNKLNYNDWYMLSLVPEQAAVQGIFSITKEQQKLGISIGLCTLVYLLAILILWVTQRSNVEKLTGALTLDGFKRAAKKIMRKHPEQRYIFIKLDIKNFKLINRVYDFAEGDRVIKNTANAIRMAIVGLDAAYARAGTDDFVIILPYTERERLNDYRAKFISIFRELMGPQFTTAVEFPTGQYITTPEDSRHPDVTEFLEKANFAHRAAKQNNLDIIVDYVEDLEKEAIFQKAIEDKMSSALTNEEFQLYLQPKYSVPEETLCGAEALVRWTVDGKAFMHPTDFVPVLERNGFIVRLDKYMFECAVQKIHSILVAGDIPVPISVNFSRCHLPNERFVQELCEIADHYRVPHQYLEIELTESAVCDNVERIMRLIGELHNAGFTLSMDDFGSGYSSLGLLKDLKVDVIKIDRGFFELSSDSCRARTVIANIIRLTQELQIKTVAEGVEELEQVQMLRELGCDIIQGYYYSRPVPADDLALEAPVPVPAYE